MWYKCVHLCTECEMRHGRVDSALDTKGKIGAVALKFCTLDPEP